MPLSGMVPLFQSKTYKIPATAVPHAALAPALAAKPFGQKSSLAHAKNKSSENPFLHTCLTGLVILRLSCHRRKSWRYDTPTAVVFVDSTAYPSLPDKPATSCTTRAVHATAARTTAVLPNTIKRCRNLTRRPTKKCVRALISPSTCNLKNHHRKPRSSPFFFALRISSPRTFWGAPTHRQYSVMTCECNAIAW